MYYGTQSSGAATLNRHLCQLWLWDDILFYLSKSVCMIVKPMGRNVSPLMFLNGAPLEYVDTVKHLGVLRSHDMKDNADMRGHLRNLYARSNLIFRKFHHCSALILSKLTSTVCYNSFSLIFILFLFSMYTYCSICRIRSHYERFTCIGIMLVLVHLPNRVTSTYFAHSSDHSQEMKFLNSLSSGDTSLLYSNMKRL